VAAALPAGLEEELEPHADAQEGAVGPQMRLDRLHQPPVVESPHGIAEGTNSREDEYGGSRDAVGIRRDHRLGAEPFKRFLHAPQIAAAIIDDRDHAASVKRQR